ncbi:hypothetical protein JVU11DRAFT_9968 [Chiua virens]|nr:hypothetical protein JVU11DRAFT_9968 [Chiua virens]
MAMTCPRRPDSVHQGKNGFREAGHPPANQDNPDDITIRNVRLAQYILANTGTYIPSPETLRKLGESKSPPPETVDSVTEKIKQLKRQHRKDLENLFKFQLSEYRQELVDHRISHDVSAYMDIDESYPDQVEFRKALQDLDKEVLEMDHFKRDAEDALSTFRHAYLKTLISLVKKRSVLESQDTAARRKRDAWFPQSEQQYHNITDREAQLRVARFLTSSSQEQEKMRDEFGWAYRAVHPLLIIYKNNISFKSEVDNAMSGLNVPDPRRRSSIKQPGDVPPASPACTTIHLALAIVMIYAVCCATVPLTARTMRGCPIVADAVSDQPRWPNCELVLGGKSPTSTASKLYISPSWAYPSLHHHHAAMAPAGPGSNSPVPVLSDISTIIHNLILDMKALEAALQRWSCAQASTEDVSNCYVQFGVEFNAVLNAFEGYDIPTNDLQAIPSQLRSALEECLGEAPSYDGLDRYLPEIRRLLAEVLRGLRAKQPAWRNALDRPPIVASNRSYTNSPAGARSSSGLLP